MPAGRVFLFISVPEKGFLKKNDIVGILKYEAPFPSDVKIEVFDAAFTDHEVKTKRANRR